MKYIIYNGKKFTKDDKTGYYLNSTMRKRLHRYVWECNRGEIPVGCQVHHINGDKDNNEISNLCLMSTSEHARYHSNIKAKENYEAIVKNLTLRARPAASKWHGSKEGIEWHKKHGKDVAVNMKVKKYICLQCGKILYKKPFGTNKFCSNSCKSKYRRESGIDDITVVCKVCGKGFKTNKYKKASFCSRTCVNRGRYLNELHKSQKD